MNLASNQCVKIGIRYLAGFDLFNAADSVHVLDVNLDAAISTGADFVAFYSHKYFYVHVVLGLTSPLSPARCKGQAAG